MQPAEFFKMYAPYAEAAQIAYGVPASITLAQAALESGWGKYAPGNNFFGIKDQPNDEYTGPYTEQDTTEYINGNYQHIISKFRKYNTPLGSFNDHATFLQKNSRYKGLFSIPVTDYKGWATGLKAAGYATAPNYPSKLVTLIEGYNLQQYTNNALIKKK